MARRVFFSFHYKDVRRVVQVRNSHAFGGPNASVEFFDAGLWESVKLRGNSAIRSLIDDGLDRTTVTAVLIGEETWKRPWVKYEIEESIRRGNGLLGIQIHNCRDPQNVPCGVGINPFIQFEGFKRDDGSTFSWVTPRIYDWVLDSGYYNFGSWVEDAYERSPKAAGDDFLRWVLKQR